MPSHMPLWMQRLSPDLRRRLEIAEANAREALSDAHAAQALDLVAIFAPRIPFDEAVDRYIETMDLPDDDAELVRTRALVALSDRELGQLLARERHRTGLGLNWRHATPLGAMRFVRRQMRRSAEEDLWMELAAARAEEALVLTHIRYAQRFVDVLEEEVPPDRAVSLYVDRMEVPVARARSIYQRALAGLAPRFLPRLANVDLSELPQPE